LLQFSPNTLYIMDLIKKSYYLFPVLCTVILFSCSSEETYKDPNAPIEERISNLLGLMTLEEKAAQMDMLSAPDILIDTDTYDEEKVLHFIDSMGIGSIHDFYPKTATLANVLQKRAIENTRLGIPLLFIEEGLHGYVGNGSTTFPVSLASASSWDTTLVYNIGRAIGTEARAHGVHFLLCPNLDLGREARWGRIEETFGEDVYLASRMGVSIVKGMQGDDLRDNNTVVAEPKHFGIHGIPEGGSNTAPVFIGEREARSTHLYVFEKAVREGHARGVMAAYHDIDGVPCISNHWLLTEVLRDEWGFDGMVVTDLGAIRRLLKPHYTAADPKEATAQAVNAGLDMQFYDFPYDVFQQAVVDGVKDGSISQQSLDRAVSAILRIKFELGLFDNPYTDESLISKVFHNEKHQQLALEAGRKSIVLLKNENNVLPLDKHIKKIALLGNLANTSSVGGYSPKGAKGETIYEALTKRFGKDIEIIYIQGEVPNRFTDIPSSVLSNRKEPGKTGLYTEYFNNIDLAGAPSYTAVEPDLSNTWWNLSPAPGVQVDNFSIRWSGYITAPTTGIYEFSLSSDDYSRLYINNTLIIDNWTSEKGRRNKSGSIQLIGDQPTAICLEYAELDENASVSLRWRSAGVIDDADYYRRMAQRAATADAVIVVSGETNQEVGEGKDRQNLNMHDADKKMLEAASKSGKPVISVMLNGRPLVATPVAEYSDAILEAWYPGESGGSAVADILFGDYNPSAKLVVSIPKYQGQTPVYYAKKPSSPGSYTDGNGTPLYPFGHGLSYTEFTYNNLRITPEYPAIRDTLTVSLEITNTGKAGGTETVQLYVRDVIASVATPVKALKGFAQVYLEAGETKTVTIPIIPEEHLWIVNLDMKRIVEPGAFEFMLGSSSSDIRMRQTIELKYKNSNSNLY
jgi:beta-glucosidase